MLTVLQIFSQFLVVGLLSALFGRLALKRKHGVKQDSGSSCFLIMLIGNSLI